MCILYSKVMTNPPRGLPTIQTPFTHKGVHDRHEDGLVARDPHNHDDEGVLVCYSC